MKRLCLFIVIFIFISCLCLPYYAESSAVELTDKVSINCGEGAKNLTDGNVATYVAASSIRVSCKTPIFSLYIKFYQKSTAWTLSADGISAPCGRYGYLHEYVDVSALIGTGCTEITLDFGQQTEISELQVFGQGEIPSDVQIWRPPCEKADLLLFSAHSDDEHLYFAGILPYYGGELGYNVQVVYMTTHYSEPVRAHEALDGLWTAGISNYPVKSSFPDIRSRDIETALNRYKEAGITEDDFIEYEVGLIRRFKPLVVVTHDFDGEYKHGTHMLVAKTVVQAVQLAAERDTYAATAHGVWDTPKTYIHLYRDNPVILDWDRPLEKFGGLTAFQVSQNAYKKHISQHIHKTLSDWMYGKDRKMTAAAAITLYSPCQFGLYRSTVGADKKANDLFENLSVVRQTIRPKPNFSPVCYADVPVSPAPLVPTEAAEAVDRGIYFAAVAAVFVIVIILLVLRGGVVNEKKGKEEDR